MGRTLLVSLAVLALSASTAAACPKTVPAAQGAFAGRFVLALADCGIAIPAQAETPEFNDAAAPASVGILFPAWPSPLAFAHAAAAARPLRAARARLAAPAFDALVRGVAYQAGVDPLLVHAIVHVESNAQPGAVSIKGATGLMQLMPGTAAMLGVRDPKRTLHDPVVNLMAGSRYVRQLHARYGDLRLALAAYNAGPGAVDRYGSRVPPYPETQAYVAKVLARYAALRRGVAA